MTSCVLQQEIDKFTYHLSYDEYHLLYNDFDIVIESNTGLSLKGTRGEENQYDNCYNRRVGFYNSTILCSINDQYNVVSIYEGTNENFISAFNLDLKLDSNTAAVTSKYAEKYNFAVGNVIKLYIGEQTYQYTIDSIVDSTGMIDGEYVFILGDNLKKHYAFKNMYNVILLDIKDGENYQHVYSHIQNEYKEYSVKNINDVDVISSLSHSTLAEIVILFCGVFVLLSIVLTNMFDHKIKKQEEYFILIGKKNYFIINKLILYLILIAIGFVISVFSVKLIFHILLKSFNCRFPFKVLTKSYILSLILPLVLIASKTIFSFGKLTFKRKYYLILISVLTIVSILLYIIFKDANSAALWLIISVIFGTILIVELLFLLLKYLLPFTVRVYIYDLGKKNFILTILQLSYIFITLVVYVMISCFNTYTTQIKEIDKIINVDKVAISKYIIDENDNYDMIRLNENGRLLNRNIDIVVGVNSVNFDKYITYGTLSNEEKTLFDSTDNYIILSKYYKNVCNVDINETITLTINGKDENYKILKFVDHVYKNIVVVNNSEHLYYGYVLPARNINEGLLNDFNNSKYIIVNFQNSFNQFIHTTNIVLSIIQYFIIGLSILIILFSIYVVYQEYIYNHNSLKKMKLLGYSNKTMFKVSLVKLIYNLLLILVVGSLFVILMIYHFDDLLRMLNTVMYLTIQPWILLISLSVTIIAMLIGYIYSFVKYRYL